MKRLLIAILLLSSALLAQNSLIQVSPVTTTTNIGNKTLVAPVPNATITICTAQGSGIPCSPLATLYKDAAGTTTQPNPFTTDSSGNWPAVYAPAGTYTYTITGAGITGSSYTLQIGVGCDGNGNCTARSFNVHDSTVALSKDATNCCTGFLNVNTGIHAMSSFVTDGAFQGNKNGDGVILWNGDFSQPLNHSITLQAGDTTSGNVKLNEDEVLTEPDITFGATGANASGYLLGADGANMASGVGHCLYLSAGPTSPGAGAMQDSGFGCNTNISFPAITHGITWNVSSFTMALKPAGVSANETVTLPDPGANYTLAGLQFTQAFTAQQNFSAGIALVRSGNVWLTDGSTLGELDIGTSAGGSAGGSVNASEYKVAGQQISAANLSDGTIGIGPIVLSSKLSLSGSVSVGGSSVPANACTDTSQAVTGAATTMAVVVSPSGALGTNWTNFTWSGYVAGSNTVQIHICNVTAGALTPAVQTFEIRVIQ